VSALLLIGSRLPDGLTLTIGPGAVSLPYVRLTADVLASFGVAIDGDGERRFRIENQDYRGREYRIEGDHSSASYFLAAAAIVGGVVRVELLRPDSSQPDAVFPRLLGGLGCEIRLGRDWVEARGRGPIPGFDLDLTHFPDLAPTVAAIGLFAEGPCVIRGIEHARAKESDRVEVIAAGLRALGRDAAATRDSLRIGPPPSSGPRGGAIVTASDHRIAMAFAIAGLRIAGVTVDDAECVAKSNEGFWGAFERLESGTGTIRTGS
jgi:3-phosphoshikimate 1-carboxyvinyltransferase